VVRFHGEDPDETTFTPGPLARGCGRDRPLTIATLDEAIRRAVRERLEADVPLGCFLSGGVDSSLIASYAQEVKPDLATFTVRMPDPGLDESNAAEQIAAALGTSHTTLECGATPAEDLPRLIAQTGLPFGDSSLLPTHWLSRAVRRHATVALSGDGGDELFAGYDRHAAAARVGPYARLLAHYPFGPGPGTRSRRARAARLADACRHDGYLDLVSVFPRSMLAQLGVEAPAEAPVAWDVGAALAHDQGHYLPDDLLVKSDSAAMAAALEVRSPLLDARVVALANGAPVATLMPGGERKGLLRALARRRLPAPAMDRPKQGFAIPVGGWFRTDFGGMGSLLGDTLSSADPLPVSALGCAIDLRYARRLLDEHLGGARDHSQRLYVLLVLALYARALTATR
jgi:asparagine synthase (glutamine-hydrolysing)